MAHLSGDQALLRRVRARARTSTARPPAKSSACRRRTSTTEQRRYVKAINFGLIYGMSAFGLAQQLGIERGAAQQLHRQVFRALSRRRATYMQRTRELAREQGYVETVFGRRLWLPDIKSGERAAPRRRRARGDQRADAGHRGRSHQARDDRGAGLARARAGSRRKLIMQVHDELVLEVPDGELARVKDELPGLMTGVATLRVPLVVDVGVGQNWEEAH